MRHGFSEEIFSGCVSRPWPNGAIRRFHSKPPAETILSAIGILRRQEETTVHFRAQASDNGFCEAHSPLKKR